MNPGATTSPFASMVCLPFNGPLLTSRIFPSLMPTLRTASSPDSGSITHPLAITMSYVSPSARTVFRAPKPKHSSASLTAPSADFPFLCARHNFIALLPFLRRKFLSAGTLCQRLFQPLSKPRRIRLTGPLNLAQWFLGSFARTCRAAALLPLFLFRGVVQSYAQSG